MIATLIRQDPAIRSLRGSLPLALAAGLFVGALVSGNTRWLDEGFRGVDQGWFVFGLCQVWLVLLLFMIVSHITVRCARLSLALPIATRELWRARIISITMAGLLPLAVFTLTIAVYPAMFQGRPGPTAEVLHLGATMGLGLVLGAMLYQTPSPGLSSIRAGRMYILYATVVSCGIPVLILVSPRSLLLAFAMAAASAILGVRIYRSLPPVLSLAPGGVSQAEERDRRGAVRAAEPGSAVAGGYVPSRARYSSALLHLTAFRVLVNHPLTWVILPIAAFYAYSWVRTYYLGGDLQPFFLISLIFLIGLMFQAIIRVHRLDHFPIRRRLVFAYAVLPIVLVTVGGVAAGQIHFMLKQSQYKMIHVYCRGEGCDHVTVAVPQDCWEITWDGVAPAATSPWGESHVPKTFPLYRGSSVALYNPYEVGETSSDDFVELQINRAIESIYGVPAPAHRAGPASGQNAELAGSSKEGEPAVIWPDNRGSWTRNRTMATRALLLGLLTTSIMSLGLQQFRAPAQKHVYPWLFQGLAAPILLLLGGLYVANQMGYASFRAFAAFPEVLIRKLGEAFPLPNVAIWALAFAVLLAGYLLVQSRFKKIEAPIQHKKKLSEY